MSSFNTLEHATPHSAQTPLTHSPREEVKQPSKSEHPLQRVCREALEILSHFNNAIDENNKRGSPLFSCCYSEQKIGKHVFVILEGLKSDPTTIPENVLLMSDALSQCRRSFTDEAVRYALESVKEALQKNINNSTKRTIETQITQEMQPLNPTNLSRPTHQQQLSLILEQRAANRNSFPASGICSEQDSGFQHPPPRNPRRNFDSLNSENRHSGQSNIRRRPSILDSVPHATSGYVEGNQPPISNDNDSGLQFVYPFPTRQDFNTF